MDIHLIIHYVQMLDLKTYLYMVHFIIHLLLNHILYVFSYYVYLFYFFLIFFLLIKYLIIINDEIYHYHDVIINQLDQKVICLIISSNLTFDSLNIIIVVIKN